MRQEHLENFRRQLMAMRENLLMDIRHKNAEAAELIDSGVPDPGDQSLNDYLSDFLHLLSDSHREEIMKIDEALRRMREGTYGTCQNCGEPIPLERLEVQPYAELCVPCKEDLEEDEARRTGRPEQGKL